jgi:hypothetical protein
MTQAARLESLEKFRAGTIAYLLATDVAARGLDIQGVQVRPAAGGAGRTPGPPRGPAAMTALSLAALPSRCTP